MSNPRNIVVFTMAREGGKSSSQSDNAKAYPSPCGNGKNGYPIHTNKGVTWKTFTDLAPVLGYVASCSNFMNMPFEIWLKIFMHGYWNPMHCSEVRNEAIANIFVTWAYMSGQGNATNILKDFFKDEYGQNFGNLAQIVAFVNEIDANDQNERLFNGLMAARRKWLLAIPGSANDAGWLTRENLFYAANLPYVLRDVTSQSTKKVLIYAGVTIALGISMIVYGKFSGKQAQAA